jgi:hypothetical protein
LRDDVFRDDVLRAAVLRAPPFRAVEPRLDALFPAARLREEPPRGGGTFAPFSRASESPIAIACLRLFTAPPCPAFPRFSVPRLRRRIALSTLFPAAREYRRPVDFRPLFRPDFPPDLLVAIGRLR